MAVVNFETGYCKDSKVYWVVNYVTGDKSEFTSYFEAKAHIEGLMVETEYDLGVSNVQA